MKSYLFKIVIVFILSLPSILYALYAQNQDTLKLEPAQKATIFQELQKLLTTRNRDSAMNYLDKFYGIINNKRLLDKLIPLGNQKPLVSDSTGDISF